MAERVDDEDAVERSRSDVRARPRASAACRFWILRWQRPERLRLTVDADGADGVGSSFRFWGDLAHLVLQQAQKFFFYPKEEEEEAAQSEWIANDML